MGEKGLLKIVLALACLAVLAVLAVTSDHASADDRSGVSGVEPPFFGDWHIDRDTNVTGANLTLSKNVYVYTRINLVIKDSTIIIKREKVNGLEVYHQFLFRVDTAAVVTVINSTLVLDTFQAIGQAALTFQNGTRISTTGRFLAGCSALFFYDTSVSNAAPNGLLDQPGEDAICVLDGRVNAEMYRVSVINKAGDAGDASPGADGSPGGSALLITNVSLWVDCTVKVLAGSSMGGGLSPGASGGAGGLGGDAELILFGNYLERTNITVTGTAGGNGARGADNTAGNAGDGGDGAEGGNARISITSPSTLEVYVCNFLLSSGEGGSGGPGGEGYNGDGGAAGSGVNAGVALFEVTSMDDVTLEDSAISVTGSNGGWGGDYGRHSGGLGRKGIPKPGGDGGTATISIDGRTNLFIDRTRMNAKGGAGSDGGSGYDQGETGGNGAMAELKVVVQASVEAKDLLLAVFGGLGGSGGPAFSNINGNGGDGGDAKLEFSGLLDMLVERFSLNIYTGKGGKGNTPTWNGAEGIPTFNLETIRLEMWDGVLDQPLDDLTDNAEGNLYNISFPFASLIPVLPTDNAQVWTWFPVDIRVVDSHDLSKARPLKDHEVQVIQISTGATIAIRKTDANGYVTFYLQSFYYTSQKADYIGGYLVTAISPDGKSLKTNRIDVQGPVLRPNPFFIYLLRNTSPPDVFVEFPESERSITFSEQAKVLETYGFVTDKDESPIVNMYARLYLESDDSTNWPRVKLALSPQPLSEVTDENARWGRYFQPEANQNRWRWFARFTIIGGDVLYKSGAYMLQVDAYDGANTGTNKTPIDIKITPKPPIPTPRAWATVSPTVEALGLVEFNGSVMNIEELKANGVELKFYAWDFTSDGQLDFYSTDSGATFYIYDQVPADTYIRATFYSEDSLGRSINVTKDINVKPYIPAKETTMQKFFRYMPMIIGVFVVALVIVGGLSIRAGRVREAKEVEERKRVEEALANIHECPRCGALLDSKFATCDKCKTEDMLLEAQELLASLKEKGIVPLEQEDMLEKALISFEGLDYDTAQMFIKQATDQANLNKRRHDETVKELERVEQLIKALSAKGVAIPDVEMRVYHSKLALTRSDFKSAKEIADTLIADVTRLDAEARKDEIFEAIQKAERDVRTQKALGEKDTVPAGRAVESAKAAYGGQDYVQSESFVKDVYKLLKDPTWTPEREREAEEERVKREVALKATQEETSRIMEEERKRQELLAAVSVAASKEVKVKTFEEEKRPREGRVVTPKKGEVVEHVTTRERVVEAEAPPAPQMPVYKAEPRAPELEVAVEKRPVALPEERPETVAAPRPPQKPVEAPAPKPVQRPAEAPAAHAPAPRPVARPEPVAARPMPVARPVPKPMPVAKPVPKPVAAEADVPKPAPRPVAAPVPKPAPKPIAAGDAPKAAAADKVPCKTCGRDIKPTWKKCPFCGTQQ